MGALQWKKRILSFQVLIISLSACGTSAEPTPTSTPEPTATNAPAPTPTPLGGGSGWITFSSDRDENFEINVMDVYGGGIRRLTDNSAIDDDVYIITAMFDFEEEILGKRVEIRAANP